ncbi:MAG: hypothetical protein R6U35_04755 [Candidatus Humimicrobiaceae bacterium]
MFKKTSFIFFLSISMPLFLILPSCQGQTEARRIYQVEKGDLIIATEADCKVISKNVSNISFEINGKLKNIIDENIKLKKGDLVAELEREEIEVEIEAAELQISAKHKEMDLAKIDLKEALEKHHVIVQLLELNKKIAEQEMLGAYQGLEDAISYLNEIEDSAVYDEAQEEMAEGSVHEAETQYNIAELQRGTTYWEMLGQKLSA